MMGKLIRLDDYQEDSQQKESDEEPLRPFNVSVDSDISFSYALEGNPIDDILDTAPQARHETHANNIVASKPEELRIFCNTLTATSETAEPTPEDAQWGDVFAACGPVYGFLFTLYTVSYIFCARSILGEQILQGPADIIINASAIRTPELIRGTFKWINRYCPALCGVRVAVESPEVVQGLVMMDPDFEIDPDSPERED
ncbi:hypothetical protein ACFL4G_12315 [Thermodesulfobacteriota bacterium]